MVPNLLRVLFPALLLAFVSPAKAFYDPTTGRWLNRDPLGDEAFLTQQMEGKPVAEQVSLREESFKHPYRFVDNDPVNHFDPFGLAKVKIAGVYGLELRAGSPAGANSNHPNSDVNRISTSVRSDAMFSPHNVAQLVRWMKDQRKNENVCEFILFGYSLGGYAIVQASRDVQREGIQVAFLLGMDPVTIGRSSPGSLPSNVKDAFAYYQQNAKAGIAGLTPPFGAGFIGSPYSGYPSMNFTGYRISPTGHLVNHTDIPSQAIQNGAVEKILNAKRQAESR